MFDKTCQTEQKTVCSLKWTSFAVKWKKPAIPIAGFCQIGRCIYGGSRRRQNERDTKKNGLRRFFWARSFCLAPLVCCPGLRSVFLLLAATGLAGLFAFALLFRTHGTERKTAFVFILLAALIFCFAAWYGLWFRTAENRCLHRACRWKGAYSAGIRKRCSL